MHILSSQDALTEGMFDWNFEATVQEPQSSDKDTPEPIPDFLGLKDAIRYFPGHRVT